MRYAVLVWIAACATGCGVRCPDRGMISISFGTAHVPVYSATLQVAARHLDLTCPQDQLVDGWEVSCQSNGILVTTTGVDLNKISEVRLAVIGANTGVLLPEQVLSLNGPVASGDSCEREADVMLTFGPIEPTFRLTPTSNDFGAIPVGSSSAFVFTLVNTGTSRSGIPQVTVMGGDFSVAGPTCNASLTPGDRCEVGVVFRPTTAGPRAGLLAISVSALGTGQAALSGEGVAPDAGGD